MLLWITLEGIYQIIIEENIAGAAILALGINIKIIPLLALVYLFFKQKYSAMVLAVTFVCLSLFLPAVFIGVKYNNTLLNYWIQTVNPSKKYFFENDLGCESLTSTIPAFFYDSGSNEIDKRGSTVIVNLSVKNLTLLLQGIRLLLIISIIPIVTYHKNRRKLTGIFFLWEIGYLMLVSILLFPHQMNYSMLYFVPAGAYIILFYSILLRYKTRMNFKEKAVGIIASTIMVVLSISGRDVIGSYIVDLLAFYHFMGLSVIAFLILLPFCPPSRLEAIALENNIAGL